MATRITGQLVRVRRIHLVLGAAVAAWWVGSLIYVALRMEAVGFALAAVVVLVIAAAVWANYAWYHYVIIGPDSIYGHFFFGRKILTVSLDVLTGVVYVLESGGRGGVAPAAEFRWPGGRLRMNLVAYGREWLRPALEVVAARGVPVDPALAFFWR